MHPMSKLPPEVPGLSSGGAFSVRLDADTSGWTLLEAGDHDDALLTRFLPASHQRMTFAQAALAMASLRGPQRVPVAVGLYGQSLVLSMRLERSGLTTGALDAARAELLRFAAHCCRA